MAKLRPSSQWCGPRREILLRSANYRSDRVANRETLSILSVCATIVESAPSNMTQQISRNLFLQPPAVEANGARLTGRWRLPKSHAPGSRSQFINDLFVKDSAPSLCLSAVVEKGLIQIRREKPFARDCRPSFNASEDSLRRFDSRDATRVILSLSRSSYGQLKM